MSPSVRTAIIIGGGIAGLTTAIALRQAGIQASVYEQSYSFRPIGAGMTLWANAIHALRLLGLADQVIAAGSKLQRALSLSPGGRILKSLNSVELETRTGEPTIAIHRAELHRVLLSALPPESIHLNKTFQSFQQDGESIEACFSDGTTATADLLIGADGIHSTLRQQFLPGLRLRYAGYTAWRGVVEPDDPLVLGTTSESWGVGQRFGIVPISPRQVYWFAVANLPPGRDPSPELLKQDLLNRFARWHTPIPTLLVATPPGEIIRTDIFDIPPFSTWSQGRAVLLGDSAHPTTPNMGQGACMAIESAVVLARALQQESSISAAVQRYEQERRPRTSWITRQSWQVGRVGQLPSAPLCALRNFVLRLTPNSVLMSSLLHAAGFRI